jgi:hypothetical protein
MAPQKETREILSRIEESVRDLRHKLDRLEGK